MKNITITVELTATVPDGVAENVNLLTVELPHETIKICVPFGGMISNVVTGHTTVNSEVNN